MLPLISLLLGLLGGDEPVPPTTWATIVTKKLTEVDLPVHVLGSGWRSSPGLKIDDLTQTDGLDQPTRQTAEQLSKSGPPGLKAVGDYTLVKTSFPLNTVTVRVFVFTDPNQCRAWWIKKYRYDEWEKHYRPVASDRFLAVDSLQENKRAVAFGNVWLTTHQLGKGEEHLRALTAVIDSLTRK